MPALAQTNGYHPRDTTTSLIYSRAPKGQKAFHWINPPKDGTPLTNLLHDEFDWDIQDLRNSTVDFGTDKTGFDHLQEPTSMKYQDWDSEDVIATRYYDEVKELLKRATGGKRVTIFDHTIRRQPPEGVVVEDTPSSRQPVRRVHVDQTPESARNRVKRHDADDAEALLKERVRLINVWRPLRGPVKDIPLAVADFRSLNPKTDFEPSDLIYSPDQIGETFLVKHNTAHKWYYVSEMSPNEVLLLKCYDSDSPVDSPVDGIASLTPHTAFIDKRYKGQSDIPTRESIEIRALVYG